MNMDASLLLPEHDSSLPDSWVDFGEKFTRVVKVTVIRMILARLAHLDVELHQIDVVTVFLSGDLEEDAYTDVPERVRSKDNQGMAWKLQRFLYGQQQAPRGWNLRIDPFLVSSFGFQKFDGDLCLDVKETANQKSMIIPLYVDDPLLAGKNMKIILQMKQELNSRLEKKDLGEAKVCIGLEISRNRNNRNLFLSQTKYTKRILLKSEMNMCKPVATPMDDSMSHEKRLEQTESDTDSEMATNVPYEKLFEV